MTFFAFTPWQTALSSELPLTLSAFNFSSAVQLREEQRPGRSSELFNYSTKGRQTMCGGRRRANEGAPSLEVDDVDASLLPLVFTWAEVRKTMPMNQESLKYRV